MPWCSWSKELSLYHSDIVRQYPEIWGQIMSMAHVLMENRHGMLVDFQTTRATGTAERDIVPELLEQARGGAFIPERWAETKATTPATAWRTCAGAG